MFYTMLRCYVMEDNYKKTNNKVIFYLRKQYNQNNDLILAVFSHKYATLTFKYLSSVITDSNINSYSIFVQ